MSERPVARLLPAGLLAGVLTALAACARPPVAPAGIPGRPSGVPRSGLEVVGAMRRAHPSRELRALSFTVRVEDHRLTPARVTRARGMALLPGRIREDRLPASRRSGYVRNRQRLALFDRGRRVARVNRVDLATLMTYDVFAQSADSTIMWLDSAGVRYGLVRFDELDGRPAWVVGAARGDSTSPQFWVDAERWRVLRVIQREPWQSNRLADIRFGDFEETLQIPIPRRVDVYRDGRLELRRQIGDLRSNPKLPAGVFNLTRWQSVD